MGILCGNSQSAAQPAQPTGRAPEFVVNPSDIKDILIDKNVENLLYKSMRSAQERQKSANAPTVKQSINPNVYGMPGKVLQIDGDNTWQLQYRYWCHKNLYI